MGATVGNQFWKQRSKHGRGKSFESPEALWESACEYFQWCEDNPWTKKDWVGKDGDEVQRETPRPLTLSGLSLFLDCSEQTLRNYGKEDTYKDFFEVITRIEQTIRTQKFEGAAVGVFNASIIARDLGLTDKVESKNENTNTHTGEVTVRTITSGIPIAGKETDVDTSRQ